MTAEELTITVHHVCEEDDDGISGYQVEIELKSSISSALSAEELTKTAESNCSEPTVLQLDFYGDYGVKVFLQGSRNTATEIESTVVCSKNLTIDDTSPHGDSPEFWGKQLAIPVDP